MCQVYKNTSNMQKVKLKITLKIWNYSMPIIEKKFLECESCRINTCNCKTIQRYAIEVDLRRIRGIYERWTPRVLPLSTSMDGMATWSKKSLTVWCNCLSHLKAGQQMLEVWHRHRSGAGTGRYCSIRCDRTVQSGHLGMGSQ